MTDTNSLVKVLIRVEPAEWHSIVSETLWATPRAPDVYRLENSPFYARGYSYLDVVRTRYVEEEGFPVVEGVMEPSGHSTYAIWVNSGVEGNRLFTECWQPLQDIGCTYEGVHSKLFSVDVPASTDVKEAFRLMQLGEDAGVWNFQEQNYAHTDAN